MPWHVRPQRTKSLPASWTFGQSIRRWWSYGPGALLLVERCARRVYRVAVGHAEDFHWNLVDVANRASNAPWADLRNSPPAIREDAEYWARVAEEVKAPRVHQETVELAREIAATEGPVFQAKVKRSIADVGECARTPQQGDAGQLGAGGAIPEGNEAEYHPAGTPFLIPDRA